MPLAGAAVLLTSESWRWALAVAAVLLLGIVAYEAVAFYRTPMVPATAEGVLASRHWERVGLAILGALAVLVIAALWCSRAV